MLTLMSTMKPRLQALPALTGWAVRLGSDTEDKRTVPAIDLRCTGAQVKDSGTRAIGLEPIYTLTLVVPRSDAAFGQLDAAVTAVIASLHNWSPGDVAGQYWGRMALLQAREPEFTGTGLAGFEMAFKAETTYHGAPPPSTYA